MDLGFGESGVPRSWVLDHPLERIMTVDLGRADDGAPRTGPKPVGSTAADPELLAPPVAVGDVQLLHLLELIQEVASDARVVPVALELGNDRPLLGDMPFALDNMPFGLSQVLLPHRAIDRGVCHSLREARHQLGSPRL
jgi:hypothetical protein